MVGGVHADTIASLGRISSFTYMYALLKSGWGALTPRSYRSFGVKVNAGEICITESSRRIATALVIVFIEMLRFKLLTRKCFDKFE